MGAAVGGGHIADSSRAGEAMDAVVLGVSSDGIHAFSKRRRTAIELIEGFGVRGDAHAGVTVQHRSRVARTPSAPNLRQVHLLPAELFDDLAEAGFDVGPGQLGENITTRGIDLLDLPVGARLVVGDAVVTVTGLRNPCAQINGLHQGLLGEVLARRADGTIERRAGVMGIVSRGGVVTPGDAVTVELPARPHAPLAPV